MKIVIDDKIPYIRESIGKITDDAVYIRGSRIGPDDVRDADALIVRTRTRCDRRLLEGSRVSFVATATIGIDHMDTVWMEREGIEWANCPGCNAGSVAQYVLSSMLRLRKDRPEWWHEDITAGIVGFGHVGKRVKEVFDRLGFRVIVNDPPAGIEDGVSLERIAEEADIISFHVPLVMDGPYSTWRLGGGSFFRSIGSKKPYIINTSRGGVVDERLLLEAIRSGVVGGAIIDTWEGEPYINRDLMGEAFIATPHIAGYSADGKVTADNMVLDSLCRHFGVERPPDIEMPPLPEDKREGKGFLDLYDPMADCERLRRNPERFEELREDYPVRRERAPWLDETGIGCYLRL